jgi:hypothetical protein
MPLVATVGVLSFSFVRSTHAFVPPFQLRPLLRGDSHAVSVTDSASETYLVIDHRVDEEAPSRVEFWRPTEPVEGPIGGLLVFAEAAADGFARTYSGITELADYLGASRD